MLPTNDRDGHITNRRHQRQQTAKISNLKFRAAAIRRAPAPDHLIPVQRSEYLYFDTRCAPRKRVAGCIHSLPLQLMNKIWFTYFKFADFMYKL